jgi:hypothetical protein
LWNLQGERDHQGGGREINPVREDGIIPSFLRSDFRKLHSMRSLDNVTFGLDSNRSNMNGGAS